VLRTLPLAAIIVSGESDESNFRVAVQLRRFARTQQLWTPPILVRQQGSDLALESLKKLIATETTDVSRIYAFGSSDEQYAPKAVLHRLDETMARAVHEDFLRGPFGDPASPGTAPWEHLLETFRSSSRAQAEHIDVKLAYAGFRRVPQPGGSAFVFSDQEVERLAAVEHWRWCVDRWLDGWTSGEKRQDELLKHDLRVPYEKLEEERKDQDRLPVRNLPKLLASADAAIRREMQISIGSARVLAPDAIEKIVCEADHWKRAGHIPIVVLKLTSREDVWLARRLQQQGITVRLEMPKPFGVLAETLAPEELTQALDAADNVIPPPAPEAAHRRPFSA